LITKKAAMFDKLFEDAKGTKQTFTPSKQTAYMRVSLKMEKHCLQTALFRIVAKHLSPTQDFVSQLYIH